MIRPGTGTLDARLVLLRPLTDDDQEFLLDLYATTRADILTVADWSESQRAAFVTMQFAAQDRYYHQQYPDATFDVVVIGDESAGRLYVHRRAADIRIVDISLLPQHRNTGVGTYLLRALIAEAAASGRTLSLHVEIDNPARRWYSRLGFVAKTESGLHVLMEWTA